MKLQPQSMQQACFLKGFLSCYEKLFNSLYLATEIWKGILITEEYEETMCGTIFFH